MSKVNFTFNITLDDSEFIQVEDHLFTTRASLLKQEHKVDLIGPGCLTILKKFEGQLTMAVVNEWLLLSKALDQTCSFHSKWDDRKILEELIAGHEHPVSWYVQNCQVA
ncbi:hypothetical protein DMA11_00035 [Marinilabiliaceae bacterium JC017]|nr:hypothetical protein DMA11_00035 [Marinilabiliaceae bacterium JC017]